MALKPGTHLGPYEVTTLIGVGGMGEVYKATDTNLKRAVAIKVLPASVAGDPERLARFQREAEVLAALNHPNIAQIHGLEKSDGTTALVMELVEGPTLADRIAQGAISLDEALPIAKQIAEALEAAHEQGIIHRDLKPANIKVRENGIVKVLDFGLAKAMEPEGGISAGLSRSPTITTPAMTQAGMILGTVAYMSPEQARGKNVDRRADIWAFGCVLYEILTGRQAFPNEETVSDTLAAVLKGEPDWRRLPSGTPVRVRDLLERCVRKDLRRRLPDIAEARIEMEEALSEPAPAAVSGSLLSPRRHVFVWSAAGLTALAVLAVLTARVLLSLEPETRVVRFEVFGPGGATIVLGQPLSPDGRTLAFVSGPEGAQQIWIRRLDAQVVQLLPGTEGAARLVWSADSQNIAFFAQGQLKRVAVNGGLPSVICNEPGRDTAWSSENVILIGGQRKPLLRVSALGGEPVPVTELTADETTHDYPDFLPDGRHFLFMARRGGPETRDVYVGSLDSKERTLLRGIHSGTRYSPTGHVVFLRSGTLMAQPFDVRRLELTGDAFPIAEQVDGGVTASFSISQNGSLAYLTGGRSLETQLAWFDRHGEQLSLVGPKGVYNSVQLSPSGRLVAFERDNDVFLHDIGRNLTSRLVSNPAADFAPKWSPGDRTIAFSSSRDPAGSGGPANQAGGNLYERAVGVVGEERQVLRTDIGKSLTDWSPDGRHLVYASAGDLWALPIPVSGDPKPLRITETSFPESSGRISPDGRWIAYLSNESIANLTTVWVQSFPEPGPRQQVSPGPGRGPRWSHDGKELFYIVPEAGSTSSQVRGTLMSVSINTAGGELHVGAETRLFRLSGDFDVSRDGRFLVNVVNSESAPSPLAVIHNWAATLEE